MLGEYSKKDGVVLLNLARASIIEQFTKIKPELPEEKQFKQARGVFVTLTKKRKLRGCIGFPYPTHALGEAVYLAAKEAAFSDPRFLAVSEGEINDVRIEISVLTTPQECEVKDVVVGRDGLMCNYLGYQGLLLPQVATEYKMNRIEFLDALCQKAGIPDDCWQKPNFKLWRFQCQIFEEE